MNYLTHLKPSTVNAILKDLLTAYSERKEDWVKKEIKGIVILYGRVGIDKEVLKEIDKM